MGKYGLSILFLMNVVSACATTSINMHVTPTKHTKMHLLIITAHDASPCIKEIASVLKKDFSFSGQFDVAIEAGKKQINKQVKQSALQGFPLIVFIADAEDMVEWRLYNALQGSLIKGGTYQKKDMITRGVAHALADIIWPEITAQPGFFSSKIAYCKQVDRHDKHDYKFVYIADFDGSHEQLLVDSPTINVGPRFNKDREQCLVFYSQFTRQNVEMRVADMCKRQRMVSTFDGINMLPAFSDDGKKVVYCASNGSGNCHIYCFENKKLTKITDNNAHNISPVLAHNGTKMYYCSDVGGRPSIYCFDMESQKTEQITHEGVCMSPSYCARTNTLAYCKKSNGIYQIYTYDCARKKHAQLTYNDGHKSECSWSPCGNYVLYSVEKADAHFLETFNVLNKGTQRLAVSGKCSYPTWSICYKEYPVVS